jgi:hypothetical protein
MADEARPHFCVDQAHRQSYREGLLGASRTPPQSRPTRSAVANALRAQLLSPFQQPVDLIAHISCDQRVRLQVTRVGVGVTPHPRSFVFGAAGLRSARFERTPHHSERLYRVRRGAHGARRTCGFDAGADLSRALPRTARRRGRLDDGRRGRAHPATRETMAMVLIELYEQRYRTVQ